MSDDLRLQRPKDEHLVQSAEAMLDYAIIAGAELKKPVFVKLLRLARRSLRDQDQLTSGHVTPEAEQDHEASGIATVRPE